MTQEEALKNAKQAISSFESLCTYEDIAQWDENAKAVLETLLARSREIEVQVSKLEAKLQKLESEHKARNFIAKMFADISDIDKTRDGINRRKQYHQQLLETAEQLQDLIDFSPNTAEARKELLEELRLRKKELTLEKRQTNEVMRQIRTGARQRSVEAYSIWDSSITAARRRAIRYEKERSLAPHEDEKAAIERQLLKVEKLLIWLGKIR